MNCYVQLSNKDYLSILSIVVWSCIFGLESFLYKYTEYIMKLLKVSLVVWVPILLYSINFTSNTLSTLNSK